MRTLFITRKYPPSKGGMEKISYGIINNFPDFDMSHVISWGGSQKGLVFFVPWAFLKAFFILFFKKIDIIHLGDCALAFMGSSLKSIFGIPIIVTAHGLDLTYKNRVYQWMLSKSMKNFDKMICVSSATRNIAINKGIDPKKCVVIPNGVDSSEWCLPNERKELKVLIQKELKLDIKNKFIILYVGRLVKRKGIQWFVENVFGGLDTDYVLLIVGTGKEDRSIKKSITLLGFKERIFMLGRVPDSLLKLLYNSADVLIMPNIPVKGDMEGFGIVAIEASSCGLPVVASDIEGIKDAVQEGKNGFVVTPCDAKGFIEKIKKIRNAKNADSLRSKYMNFTREHYDLKNISKEYYSLFKEIIR